jgi:hypothetical protein
MAYSSLGLGQGGVEKSEQSREGRSIEDFSQFLQSAAHLRFHGADWAVP